MGCSHSSDAPHPMFPIDDMRPSSALIPVTATNIDNGRLIDSFRTPRAAACVLNPHFFSQSALLSLEIAQRLIEFFRDSRNLLAVNLGLSQSLLQRLILLRDLHVRFSQLFCHCFQSRFLRLRKASREFFGVRLGLFYRVSQRLAQVQ